jgi:hypothetical protein
MSWGKAGVSMTQYRLDAGVCAARAISKDVSATPAAERMVLASRALDNAYAMAWMYYPSASQGGMMGNPWREVQNVSRAFRVEDNIAEIRNLQYDTLAACLTELGYVRFRLTDAQRDRLRHLPLGSAKRRAFLHALASDPAVLVRQAA